MGRIGDLDFQHESRLGRSSLPIRGTLADTSGAPAVNPWIVAGPVHTYSFVDWQTPLLARKKRAALPAFPSPVLDSAGV